MNTLSKTNPALKTRLVVRISIVKMMEDSDGLRNLMLSVGLSSGILMWIGKKKKKKKKLCLVYVSHTNLCDTVVFRSAFP